MNGESQDLTEHDDAQLARDIAAQKQLIAAFEAEFVPMRQRYERLRQRLRSLEGEVTRRQRLAEGSASPRPAQRRGGTLISAVLAGRDLVDATRPFTHFHFYSLGRQQIYLNRTGDPAVQVLSLYDPVNREPHFATTFGDIARLKEQGLILGVPGVPLERQGVYYVADDRPGWLRLDQIFVEEPVAP